MAKYIATYTDIINNVEVTGFCALTDKEVERIEELCDSILWNFTYKVGEEEIEYSNGEDLLSRIDFREITNGEYTNLIKIFDGVFGIHITEDFLLGVVGDEDLEDEEDDLDGDDYDDNEDDY